ncbi:MAG: CDC27 family protein [Vulcanimicrobiota bacterium]
MKEFFKKIGALIFLTAGVILGLFLAFFLISRLLQFHNINISLNNTSAGSSPERTRPAPYYLKPLTPRKPDTSRLHAGNIPDLDSIEDVEKLKTMAVKALDEKEYYDAEEILDRIKTLKPDFPDLYWYIGLTKEGEEDMKSAVDAFSAYGRSETKDPKRLLYIADFLIRQNNVRKALEILDASKKIEESTEVYYLIAKCHYLKSDYKKAIQNLNLSLKISKDYPDVHELLAECYIKTGKTKEAVDSFKEAYGVESKPYFLYRMALLTYGSGDYKSTKLYLKRYTETENDEARATLGKELLARVKIDSMKKIPPEVEQQTDFIDDIKLVGTMKSDGRYSALIKAQDASQEIREGDTVLDIYYVLNINDGRVIFIRDETYIVLRVM